MKPDMLIVSKRKVLVAVEKMNRITPEWIRFYVLEQGKRRGWIVTVLTSRDMRDGEVLRVKGYTHLYVNDVKKTKWCIYESCTRIEDVLYRGLTHIFEHERDEWFSGAFPDKYVSPHFLEKKE